MKRHSGVSGCVLDGVEWSRWTVILVKPDALRRGLDRHVLTRIGLEVDVVAQVRVTVAAWQIHVHYADMLVDADWFPGLDVPAVLEAMYVGREVIVALGRGRDDHTTSRVRALLGHFDPSRAALGTIRGDLGIDTLARARVRGRFVENLVHTSDTPAATRRDFGTWFGADQHALLDPTSLAEDGQAGAMKEVSP